MLEGREKPLAHWHSAASGCPPPAQIRGAHPEPTESSRPDLPGISRGMSLLWVTLEAGASRTRDLDWAGWRRRKDTHTSWTRSFLYEERASTLPPHLARAGSRAEAASGVGEGRRAARRGAWEGGEGAYPPCGCSAAVGARARADLAGVRLQPLPGGCKARSGRRR